MNILGISAFYHDSAVCLVKDGQVISAAQEERFSRKKHDSAFPHLAIDYALKSSQTSVDDCDFVVFYDKPFLKFERLLESYLSFAPIGIKSFVKAIPTLIKKKLWMKSLIKKELNYHRKVLFLEHHESHAASAFFPSPFKEAAFLTIDGVGEWATTSYGVGKGNRIETLGSLHFPHSLGLLYSAFTYYLGFRVNSGEYKVMGLAPYGKACYRDLIFNELINLREDGSFRLNMKYFNYCAGLTMTNKNFDNLFGGPPRRPEDFLSQKHMDLARSVQEVVEEAMLRMSKHVYKKTGCKNLCLAGGVALNCVGNGKLLRESPFKNIWVQPASGDAGGALGAALFVWHQLLDNPRETDVEEKDVFSPYLGPKYDDEEIKEFLIKEEIPFEEMNPQETPEKVADLLAEQKVIGWFQGAMEFGPRALGARSIIGDARSSKMQEIMNLKIKFRESFRPFAPTVLEEFMSDYFDLDVQSPYMLLVAPVKESLRTTLSKKDASLTGLKKLNIKRSKVPAVTHVDYSARVQSVNKEKNGLYYQMLLKFWKKHGCPVIINTSFNVRGEPIVCSPLDAYLCFMRTNMDCLVMGNFLITKEHQKIISKHNNWEKVFIKEK